LPADQPLGVFNLPAPATVAPGANASVPVSGLCPAPILVDPANLGFGWGVFALLEEQVGTNWFLKDKSLLFYGVWPLVGGFPGPGGGVIRLDPGLSGGNYIPIVLTNVTIQGPATVLEGSSAAYVGAAQFNDGSIVYFTNTVWNATRFSIQTNGVFQAGSTTFNLPLTISCSYIYYVTNVIGRPITVLNLPPPSWLPGASVTNRIFQTTLSGVNNRKHVIEAATNLSASTIWVPLATNNLGANGTLIFIDTNATNFSRRFYRAREAE
jgi:hypothetical protein